MEFAKREEPKKEYQVKPRAVLLSAYDAQSHRLWRENLLRLFPGIDWHVLTLPPRHFSWRIRGNGLQWAFANREELSQAFDLLLATSMVDLSALRGFVPSLGRVPAIVYFHENQFEYPNSQFARDNLEPKLVPLYAALCADRILFNSDYNRHSFLAGAKSLLRQLPDRLPASIAARLDQAQTLAVPLYQSEPVTGCRSDSDCLELLWNHRWEHDKGIDLLLALVLEISRQELPIRLHIAGQRFTRSPAQFATIHKLLQDHANALGMAVGNFGFVAAESGYRALLEHCDVVLSTALHEFQGLALQQACLAHCTPLAPDALVYPEFLDSTFLYPRQEHDAETAQHICRRLLAWLEHKRQGKALPRANLEPFLARSLGPAYAAQFNEFLPAAKRVSAALE